MLIACWPESSFDEGRLIVRSISVHSAWNVCVQKACLCVRPQPQESISGGVDEVVTAGFGISLSFSN